MAEVDLPNPLTDSFRDMLDRDLIIKGKSEVETFVTLCWQM